MIALTDQQLQIVMHAARGLPIDKRDVFLQRIAAALQRPRHFDDGDVAAATQQALHGLVQLLLSGVTPSHD